MTTTMSIGQHKELAAGAIKQLPIDLNAAVTQMLIDNPRLLGAYMAEWFASVRYLEMFTRPLDPVRIIADGPKVLPVLNGLDTFREFFPMAVIPDAAKRNSSAWQTEFLCILDAWDRRVQGSTFRPVVVQARMDWKMPHMLAHLRANGLEPALPQHLVNVEVRYGDDLFHNTKLVVCPTPLVLQSRCWYLTFAPGKPQASRWKLYYEAAADSWAWSENEVVLAVARD